MQKIKVTLPAAVTNLGPGLHSLGLALQLHATVEFRPRDDTRLVIEVQGEGAGRYTSAVENSLRHQALLAMMRVFQAYERAPSGIHLRINSSIPPDSGLGANAAFAVAGVIGAANLLGMSLNRDQILQRAAEVAGRADGVVTAMLGGLTASRLHEDRLIYRTLPLAAFEVVLVLPQIEDFADNYPAMPASVPYPDAVNNLQQLPLLLEALRSGDVNLLGAMLEDHLLTPALRQLIPGYGHAVEMARRAGAKAVTFCGEGPAMLLFAERHHQRIADAAQAAFDNAGVPARAWVVPVDRQGVVISIAQSA